MNKLDVKFAKLIMAMAQQDPVVSDADALGFVKYNSFIVKDLEGNEIVTLQDVAAIIAKLREEPHVITPDVVLAGINVGDSVKVLTDDAEVDGEVRSIKYQISGLGNKYYSEDEVTKK